MGIRRSLVLVLAVVLVLSAPLAAFGTNGRAIVPSAIRTASFIGGDGYESVDNTWTTAPQLAGASTHSFTSLYNKTGYTADEDWFKVNALYAGTPIIVNVKRTGGSGGSYIDVYRADGSVCESASIAFGGAADPNDGSRFLGDMTPGWWASGMAKLYWKTPSAGTFYIRHRPAVPGTEGPGYPRDAIPNVANQATSYEIHISVGDADRLAGPTRYGTAVAVSQQMWNAADDMWWPLEGPWGDGVILASGENFADGLAATSMSLRTGMPVLLTKRDYLPAEVNQEIKRLAVANNTLMWSVDASGNPVPRDNTFTVYICGSEAAVGGAVEDTLRNEKGNGVTSIRRLEGTDRYGTAVAIADETTHRSLYSRAVTARSPLRLLSDTAFVINGTAWPDGLAAGPVAAFGDAPVLMTQRSVLPSVTAEWIEDNDISKVYVVGGPSTVETSVLDAIASLSTTPTVERIAGTNRYETARLVAQFGVDNFGMFGGSVTVVSGRSPWDALSAGQLSFMTYGPLLLTDKSTLSGEIVKYYDDNLGFDAPCYIVGGEPTIDANTYSLLNNLWKRPVAK